MIDVLMILLVFFMVTSTYLDLDMLPSASPGDAPPAPVSQAASGPTVMLRISADGRMAIGGATLAPEALAETFAGLAPGTRVLVLPSGAAPTQALVSVLDLAAETGVTGLRVLQLDDAP